MTWLRSARRRLHAWLRQVGLLAPAVRATERLMVRLVARERYDGRHPQERAYLEQYAAAILTHTAGRVLDLGCGHGYLTLRIAQRPEVSAVVGIDKIADFHGLHPKVTYRTQDLIQDQRLPQGFDVIVATEFIEHIPESTLLALLPAIRDALRDGGLFIGSTPPNPSEAETFSGSPYHRREYQPEVLRGYLERFFRLVHIETHRGGFMTWIARERRMS